MSHEPPIPEAARSPYPLQPPPLHNHDAGSPGQEESAPAQVTQSTQPETMDQSWAGRARETFDRATESKVALGVAVGIGSAALLAALLFARRGSGRNERSAARSAPRRKAATPA